MEQSTHAAYCGGRTERGRGLKRVVPKAGSDCESSAAGGRAPCDHISIPLASPKRLSAWRPGPPALAHSYVRPSRPRPVFLDNGGSRVPRRTATRIVGRFGESTKENQVSPAGQRRELDKAGAAVPAG